MAKAPVVAASPAGEEIGRKLSVASFGYDKEAILELVMADKANQHFLVRYVGEASGLKPYENDKGEVQFGLLGEFEGTSRDGDVKAGTVLYMPNYITDQIASILERNKEAIVEIAVDIYANFDKESATMYVFTGRNLIKQNNPTVDKIKAQLAGIPLPQQLPAPEQ